MLVILLATIVFQTGHISTRCTNCPNDCDINGRCYCSQNCDNCANNGIELSCDTCKAGFYGPKCQGLCPDNCQDRECDYYGFCTKGCVFGLYGGRCDRYCSIGCQDRKCNKDGACSKGCAVGYYGNKCHFSCSHGCQNKECNNDNGVCSKGCVSGLYGDKCNRNCSMGCQDRECNKDKACSKGCVVGFYGHLCNVACSSTCHQGSCLRLTGTCTHGCIEGYYGETCHLYHTFTKEMSTHLDNSTRVPTIMARVPTTMESVLGAALVLVAAVLSIVLIRRRCRLRAQSSVDPVTERRYDDIMGISIGGPTHTVVDDGQRTNESSGSPDRLRLYGNILDRTTENSAQNTSLDVERGTYETLGHPDYDDSMHVYDTTV